MIVNIDLRSVFEFVRKWSVGKIIILFVMLGYVMKIYDIPNRHAFLFLSVGLLFEGFELCHNKILMYEDKTVLECKSACKCIGYYVAMIVFEVSLIALIALALSNLFNFFLK